MKIFLLYASLPKKTNWAQRRANEFKALEPFVGVRMKYLYGQFNAAHVKLQDINKESDDKLYFLAVLISRIIV